MPGVIASSTDGTSPLGCFAILPSSPAPAARAATCGAFAAVANGKTPAVSNTCGFTNLLLGLGSMTA